MKIPMLLKPKISVWLSCMVILCSLSGQAFAVHTDFELDANAIDSNTAAAPDDWDHVTSTSYTGVLEDPAPLSIFTTGGSKDIMDISSWRHKNGSVPDKDDITNAYAASYEQNGDLVVYFGADRFANSGDAQIGFWFFQNEVGLNANGTFSGVHAIGDILVISDFSQGGIVSTIKVLRWVGGMNGDSNADGKKDGPLQLVEQGTGNTLGGTFCTSSDDACAVANADDTSSPWPYTPKAGSVGVFPHGSFYEGGLNVSEVVGEICIASYLVETRSSTSPTATLKDFVLGNINTCKVSVSKSCPSAEYDAASDSIRYRIEGKVTNDGFGPVSNIAVSDDTNILTNDLGDVVAVTDFFASPGGVCDFSTSADPADPLAAGESICYRHFFLSTVAQPSDMVTATAQTSGGAAVPSATAQATCPDLGIEAGIAVTPTCSSSHLELSGGKLVVAVEVGGAVCNTSVSPLTNVAVYGDQLPAMYNNGSSTYLSGAYLAPKGQNGDCITLTAKKYYPDTIPAFPYNFGDTLSASGIASRFANTNSSCQLNGQGKIECRDEKASTPCPLCTQ